MSETGDHGSPGDFVPCCRVTGAESHQVRRKSRQWRKNSQAQTKQSCDLDSEDTKRRMDTLDRVKYLMQLFKKRVRIRRIRNHEREEHSILGRSGWHLEYSRE